MIPWTLTGTANQQAISRELFERHLFYPIDRLVLPGRPEFGWTDLNSGAYADMAAEKARGHEVAHHHGSGDRPDPLLVRDADGRDWTAGVIWTQSARIYIDLRCEADPLFAKSVGGSELMHAIDIFDPGFTDAVRNELLRRWNVPGTTWWEVISYAREYYRLAGEAWMHEGLGAYTDLEFGDKSMFAHDVGVEPEDVYEILGVRRTDYVSPDSFVHFPGGKDIYHKPEHYGPGRGVPLETFEGFRRCKRKVCKP